VSLSIPLIALTVLLSAIICSSNYWSVVHGSPVVIEKYEMVCLNLQGYCIRFCINFYICTNKQTLDVGLDWRIVLLDTHHEGVWGSGRLDPHFLDLAISWRSVSASCLGRITPGKDPGTHWIGGCVDPRAGMDDVEKRKFLTLPGLKLRPLGRKSLYRLSYSAINWKR
jgi:hypothetical protein